MSSFRVNSRMKFKFSRLAGTNKYFTNFFWTFLEMWLKNADTSNPNQTVFWSDEMAPDVRLQWGVLKRQLLRHEDL